MAKTKYVVASGYSFTSGGIIFAEGDEIPEEVFPDRTVFGKYVSQGKIIAVGKTSEVEEKKADEAPAEKTAEVKSEVKTNKKGK